jgi:hypothetical protein
MEKIDQRFIKIKALSRAMQPFKIDLRAPISRSQTDVPISNYNNFFIHSYIFPIFLLNILHTSDDMILKYGKDRSTIY